MNKIKFTAPNGVEVEGVVLNSVGFEQPECNVVVKTVYAQNRIAEVRTFYNTIDGNVMDITVNTLCEYAVIPELD